MIGETHARRAREAAVQLVPIGQNHVGIATLDLAGLERFKMGVYEGALHLGASSALSQARRGTPS